MTYDPPSIDVDYFDAGSSGRVVVLVHSSVPGAPQWRKLMQKTNTASRKRRARCAPDLTQPHCLSSPWLAGRARDLGP